MGREQSGTYRIRFHGRGGQGMKTASRILGTAFFLEGFEVQDAPRYGAERRGAPIFAYVRASRGKIFERGVIRHPDLVIVADETLLSVPAAEVMSGVVGKTVILVHGRDDHTLWKERLLPAEKVVILAASPGAEGASELRYVGVRCAGAAARLVGAISLSSLEEAIRTELAHLGETVIARNLEKAGESYESMAAHEGCVAPGRGISAEGYSRPDWVELPFEEARVSAPAIFAPATSAKVRTGLWRTMRPVVDRARCSRCLLCSTFCPEGAVSVNEEGYPVIDYEHCKGCLICMVQCPSRAIRTVPEHGGKERGEEGDRK